MPYANRTAAEQKKYQGTPEQIANRTKRNKDRREAEKAGLCHKGDNRDVDHIKPLSKGGSSKKSNLRVVSRSKNRSFARNPDSSMKKNGK